MSKSVIVFAALAALVLSARALAQDADRALLATFCDAANIKGKTCTRAKNYPGPSKRVCDVKLTPARHSGKFGGGGKTLLIVSYGSECEPHATNFGGAVLFEPTVGKFVFRGYLPGSQANECVVLPKGDQQDILLCITGFMGQGQLETGVAQQVFTHDYSGNIQITNDYLVTATDSTSAYGANVVTCNEAPPNYFGISKIAPGPWPDTVAVTIHYAGAATIRTACAKGFPLPKEISGDLAPGDAWVPPGVEESGRFVIDLATRKVAPE